ncbi:hypothetical protein [Defluviimonas salinarum]|uniref:Transglutaminase-like domain-containing protein n=1 Tax=Defluviimonas salinarum TaxID=2992147 RepID=A0ABT3J5N7_9RHOB|nr:hypothetical protein [Defluviimonas salinarum]MCW3783007.1 hypothetical protein [Defluviimonas salinarum]
MPDCPTRADIDALRPALAVAAQACLDDWQQDKDGLDEVLGAGGACQEIASAMATVLCEAGVEDVAEVYTEFDGGHVFLMARLAEGAFRVDIPPQAYETGAGYVWRKREGVTLSADDVVLHRVEPAMDREEFGRRYCEGWSEPEAEPELAW